MPEFPVIAGKKIFRRGDVVALVAADTEEHARAAAKKVKQNLEVLPAYMTFPEAAMPNAIQLHEELPNVYMEQPVFKGQDTAEIFETAPIVAEGSFHSQHEPHLPIEPETLQAYWGADGMMTIQCKCQIADGEPGIRLHGLRHPQGQHPHAAEPRRRFLRLHRQPQHLSRSSSRPSRTWTCPARSL